MLTGEGSLQGRGPPAGLAHGQRALTAGAATIQAEAHLPLRLPPQASLDGQERLEGRGGKAARGQVGPPVVSLPVAFAHQQGFTHLGRGGNPSPESQAALVQPQPGLPLHQEGQGGSLGRDIPEAQLARIGHADAQIKAGRLPSRLQAAQHPEATAGVAPEINDRIAHDKIQHQTPQSPAGERIGAHQELPGAEGGSILRTSLEAARPDLQALQADAAVLAELEGVAHRPSHQLLNPRSPVLVGAPQQGVEAVAERQDPSHEQATAEQRQGNQTTGPATGKAESGGSAGSRPPGS